MSRIRMNLTGKNGPDFDAIQFVMNLIATALNVNGFFWAFLPKLAMGTFTAGYHVTGQAIMEYLVLRAVQREAQSIALRTDEDNGS
jgi:hypothetical protein